MFDVGPYRNQTTSCNVDVPDIIFPEADNSLYCKASVHTKRHMLAHVFYKTEPAMLNYKSPLSYDHAFRADRIPPLITPVARDISWSTEFIRVYHCRKLKCTKGLKCVPLKPSVNKYNVIHDCELFSFRSLRWTPFLGQPPKR